MLRANSARLKGRLADAGYGLGWALVRWIPEPLAAWAFERIADWAWRRRGRGVAQLERNLRRVVGPGPTAAELRTLSRAAMRSYLRYWMEAFRLPVTSERRIRDGMRITGFEQIESNLEHGRGVLLALPHMGNWDHAGAWLVTSGHPFTTVQERLEPESLFGKFVAYRESLGMEILAHTGANAFGTLARRLRDGRVICLVADRDLTENGLEVEFFGATARMPAGPALLAARTGAALLPVTLWYEGESWCVQVHEEIAVPDKGDTREKALRMTQALAAVFEKGVAAHPKDWHMLQRLWVEDLR